MNEWMNEWMRWEWPRRIITWFTKKSWPSLIKVMWHLFNFMLYSDPVERVLTNVHKPDQDHANIQNHLARNITNVRPRLQFMLYPIQLQSLQWVKALGLLIYIPLEWILVEYSLWRNQKCHTRSFWYCCEVENYPSVKLTMLWKLRHLATFYWKP